MLAHCNLLAGRDDSLGLKILSHRWLGLATLGSKIPSWLDKMSDAHNTEWTQNTDSVAAIQKSWLLQAATTGRTSAAAAAATASGRLVYRPWPWPGCVDPGAHPAHEGGPDASQPRTPGHLRHLRHRLLRHRGHLLLCLRRELSNVSPSQHVRRKPFKEINVWSTGVSPTFSVQFFLEQSLIYLIFFCKFTPDHLPKPWIISYHQFEDVIFSIRTPCT